MEESPGEKRGAQSDRSHLRSKATPGRTNAATPVDIKFLGTSPAPPGSARTARPATARALNAGRISKTNAPGQGQQAPSSDKAATVAAVYLGRFHTSQSPQKEREVARDSVHAHSDTENAMGEMRLREGASAGLRRERRRTDSWLPSAYYQGQSRYPEKQRRSASSDRSQQVEGGTSGGEKVSRPIGKALNGRPVSSEEEPLHTRGNGTVPPLKLLGNIFTSSHIPQTLKHQSPQNPSSKAPSTVRTAQRTPRSGKGVEAGENSPPQALRLQKVQCSKEIAAAFHNKKSQTARVPGSVAPEIARPKGERAVLSARGNEETNREPAVEHRPLSAREGAHSLRIAVPPPVAPRTSEAPVAQLPPQTLFSYITENPLANLAWGDWQPPLPVRALRCKDTDGQKPFYHEKQSPSPPTVLFHPSSPTSSIGSLDLAHDHFDSCQQPHASCHQAPNSCHQPHDSCQAPVPQRQVESVLPPRTSYSLEDDRIAQMEACQGHMSFGSAHPSRASFIASSSPHRFGRLSSATTSEVSEESAQEIRTVLGGVSSDFAPQDEFKAAPFSLRSHPVIIPASPLQDTTRFGIPMVQSPPNLPRHFIQATTPCSPNLSRGFMIGQFDGHVPSASAQELGPDRDGPLATRVSNGATSCSGIPRPGLAQQLHESLNNPNALPGYSVGPVIGEGGFCKVRLGTHLVSGEKVAIKVIDKTRLTDPTDRKRVAREIRVLKKLNQENIIRLLEVGEASSRIHVIMEHASGGTLLDHVRRRKRLPEPEARDCLRQILVGLTYCHSQGVIHRDIKLENLLLNADRQMKIIDFGLSAIVVPGKKLRVHCGSPSYAAPEIVSRQLYDGPPVDVWSLGVVLFAMITGYLPFHASGSNKDELCQKIIAGVYKTPDTISDESKDLLRGMLTTDPRRRLTLEQVADHPWVRGKSVPCWRLPTLPTEPECRPPLDAAILSCISKRIDTQSLSESILRGDHTYFTATYHLLAARSQADRRGRACDDPDGRPSLAAS